MEEKKGSCYSPRVALFSVYPPSIQIANRLASGKIPCLLVLSHSGKKAITDVEQGVTLFFWGLSRDKDCTINPLRLLKLLIKFKPDIIHLWFAGSKFSLVMFPIIELYSRITQCPLVSTIWEPVNRIGLNLKRARFLQLSELKREIKFASHIITDAKILRNTIMYSYKIPYDKIDVISDVEMDSYLFKMWEKHDVKEEEWILFFGEILDTKG